MRTRYRAGSVQADKARARWLFRWTERNGAGFVKKAKVIGTFAEYKTKTDASLAADRKGFRALTNQSPITGATVSAIVARYKTEKMPTRFSTRKGYTSYLKNHILPQWGEKQISEVKPYLVEQWLKGLSLAPKTKSHIKGVMGQLFQCAMLWEYLELSINPMTLVSIRGITKRARKPRVLTPEEFQILLQHISGEPFRTMIVTVMCLGLRCSELLALKWSDFDWSNRTLLVQRAIVTGRVDDVKTECSNTLVPLDDSLAEMLLAWKECSKFNQPNDWVWASPFQAGEKPYSSWGIQQLRIKPAGIKAGLGPLGWHVLRHSYRSWLDATGAPMGVQKDLMRHAAIATTMNVYGGAMTADKRTANGKVVRMAIPLSAYPVGISAS